MPGSTVQTSVRAARARPGRGIDHAARGSHPPPAPLPLGPPNAQQDGIRFRPPWPASIVRRPTRPPAQPPRSRRRRPWCRRGRHRVRYLRAKDLKVCVEGEPQGVGETCALFFLSSQAHMLIRARGGFGSTKHRILRPLAPSERYIGSKRERGGILVRMDRYMCLEARPARFVENAPAPCYC